MMNLSTMLLSFSEKAMGISAYSWPLPIASRRSMMWPVSGSKVPRRVNNYNSIVAKSLSSSSILRHERRQQGNSDIYFSFYSDFEEMDEEYSDFDEDALNELQSRISSNLNWEEENDDYDDDEDEEIEEEISIPESLEAIESFSSIDELIQFAASKQLSSTAASTDWAIPVDVSDMSQLRAGLVLIANPAKFCTDFPQENQMSTTSKRPSTALLSKFGLTVPPPADLGPDKRADLLPVLILLERHLLKGCHAVILNRRTGYLMGDLEPSGTGKDDGDNDMGDGASTKRFAAFMIQPLWFGGTSPGVGGGGLDMLHLCPTVQGSKKLTTDGLFWGGDPMQAQDAMSDPSLNRVITGFDFKFFVQSTRWLPTQLENEVRDGTWFVASVSKEVLFKSRDRIGQKKSKSLWTEIMELMGGKYKAIRDQLYGENAPSQ